MILKKQIIEHYYKPFILLANFEIDCVGQQKIEATHQTISMLDKHISRLKSDIQ